MTWSRQASYEYPIATSFASDVVLPKCDTLFSILLMLVSCRSYHPTRSIPRPTISSFAAIDEPLGENPGAGSLTATPVTTRLKYYAQSAPKSRERQKFAHIFCERCCQNYEYPTFASDCPSDRRSAPQLDIEA
ncbi:hypothetical protein BDN72DRAFT_103027 [Pluteus cervinus]|uniref:Uncharacterized protein n=1 Tax=Pluteus cervinus TaxID=181527 RepID=A0ACD3B9B3_9AGAR|nr:hypothetical protein BDN72DRAFT_103027 [Pluteus cervinus]